MIFGIESFLGLDARLVSLTPEREPKLNTIIIFRIQLAANNRAERLLYELCIASFVLHTNEWRTHKYDFVCDIERDSNVSL